LEELPELDLNYQLFNAVLSVGYFPPLESDSNNHDSKTKYRSSSYRSFRPINLLPIISNLSNFREITSSETNAYDRRKDINTKSLVS
jgi:hypothetical protein